MESFGWVIRKVLKALKSLEKLHWIQKSRFMCPRIFCVGTWGSAQSCPLNGKFVANFVPWAVGSVEWVLWWTLCPELCSVEWVLVVVFYLELLAPWNGCLWLIVYPELLAPWNGCFVADFVPLAVGSVEWCVGGGRYAQSYWLRWMGVFVVVTLSWVSVEWEICSWFLFSELWMGVMVDTVPRAVGSVEWVLVVVFYLELLAPWNGCFVAKLGYWRGYREFTSIQYCVVFLRDSLLLLLAAMADSWRQELLDAQVPGPVVEEIVQLYGSKTVFKFSFLSADSLEKFAKTLLVKTKLVDNAGSDAADIHPAWELCVPCTPLFTLLPASPWKKWQRYNRHCFQLQCMLVACMVAIERNCANSLLPTIQAQV